MVRTADFSALTKGLSKGLLWGQIQLFRRKFTKLRGSQISQRAAIICPYPHSCKKRSRFDTLAQKYFSPGVRSAQRADFSSCEWILAAYLKGRQISYGQRSGPRAAFRTGWQQAPRMHTILLQSKPCVNVVRYKHVYYTNVLHCH